MLLSGSLTCCSIVLEPRTGRRSRRSRRSSLLFAHAHAFLLKRLWTSWRPRDRALVFPNFAVTAWKKSAFWEATRDAREAELTHPASTRFAHTRQARTDPASFAQRAAGPTGTRATAGTRTDRAELDTSNSRNTSQRRYTRAVEVRSRSVHENAHAVGATTSALNVAFVELRCVRIPARRSCSQAATEAHSCAFVS